MVGRNERIRGIGRGAQRRFVVGVLVALQCATAAFGTVAFAQTPPSGSSDTIALKNFEEGKKQYDAGKFDAALAAFKASITLLPSPNTRLYIARCQRSLGRIASAYVSYNLTVGEATDRLNTSGEKRFKATKEAASAEMAEIASKVPRLTIAVPTDAPPDFTVKLDGVLVPKEGWGIAVETDPGKHEIVASGSHRKEFNVKFSLTEGEQKRIDVAAERVAYGTLILTFPERPSGMSVQLDGAPVDPSTIAGARELGVGSHTVVVTAPGYRAFRWDGQVEDDKETSVSIKLTRDAAVTTARGGGSGTPLWVPLAIGGVGLVALGVGTVFAVQAKSVSDEEFAKDSRVRTLEDQDRIKTLSTRANILFVGGGVLVVGAAVLAFTVNWKSPTTDDHAQVIPWIGTTGGGLIAVRSF